MENQLLDPPPARPGLFGTRLWLKRFMRAHERNDQAKAMECARRLAEAFAVLMESKGEQTKVDE